MVSVETVSDMGKLCDYFLRIFWHGRGENNQFIVSSHDLEELLEEGPHEYLQFLLLAVRVNQCLI